MGLMLETANTGTGFLAMVSELLTSILGWGTQIVNWILATPALAYGLGISLILAAILIYKRVKNS